MNNHLIPFGSVLRRDNKMGDSKMKCRVDQILKTWKDRSKVMWKKNETHWKPYYGLWLPLNQSIIYKKDWQKIKVVPDVYDGDCKWQSSEIFSRCLRTTGAQMVLKNEVCDKEPPWSCQGTDGNRSCFVESSLLDQISPTHDKIGEVGET